MTNEPTDPDLIRIPAASRRLGVHPDTGYKMARAGEFPGAVQIGSRWLVSVPRLERFLHGEPEAAARSGPTRTAER
jgi:predicted DNA-binding transcriptional regulator AlpA